MSFQGAVGFTFWEMLMWEMASEMLQLSEARSPPYNRNHTLGAVGVLPGCVEGKSHMWVMAGAQDIH